MRVKKWSVFNRLSGQFSKLSRRRAGELMPATADRMAPSISALGVGQILDVPGRLEAFDIGGDDAAAGRRVDQRGDVRADYWRR
ncbi:hypothetical protein R3F72_11270 [Salinicola sp. 4072]|jgi:hypothetical protein|uniref:hypothetical protein n=1 Tax=Salinicola sp. 4072 TaxID=3082157 RepID=UPI002FC74365